MRNLGVDASDVLAVAGFACVVWGVALWSVAAAFVVAGALLLAVAIWPHLRTGDGRSVTGGRAGGSKET